MNLDGLKNPRWIIAGMLACLAMLSGCAENRNSKFRNPDQGNAEENARGQETSAASASRVQDDSSGYGRDRKGVESMPSDREISVPGVERVRFRIVPNAIVRALELRKGSADIEVSSLSADMIPVLAKQEELTVTDRPGTNFAYLGMNMQVAILAKRDVRQALAYATDRESLVKYLLHGEARLASGILPPNHRAYEKNVKVYGYYPAEAERLLDAAGWPRGADGMRFHVTLKVSTEEQARLMAAARRTSGEKSEWRWKSGRSKLPRCSRIWQEEIFRFRICAGWERITIRTSLI
jgi:ABC-type transport system substrate-binding protein